MPFNFALPDHLVVAFATRILGKWENFQEQRFSRDSNVEAFFLTPYSWSVTKLHIKNSEFFTQYVMLLSFFLIVKYVLLCCFDTQLLQMLFSSLQESCRCTLISHGIHRMILRSSYRERWISSFRTSIEVCTHSKILRGGENTLQVHNQRRERPAAVFCSLTF